MTAVADASSFRHGLARGGQRGLAGISCGRFYGEKFGLKREPKWLDKALTACLDACVELGAWLRHFNHASHHAGSRYVRHMEFSKSYCHAT